MTISRTTTSYPFLALAQEAGLPYGEVLWAASVLDKQYSKDPTPLNYWERAAVRNLQLFARPALVTLINAARERAEEGRRNYGK